MYEYEYISMQPPSQPTCPRDKTASVATFQTHTSSSAIINAQNSHVDRLLVVSYRPNDTPYHKILDTLRRVLI